MCFITSKTLQGVVGVDRMSDRQLTLSWKPSPAAGQHIPPTYTVEMAKMPEGGFAVINTGMNRVQSVF